MLCQALWGSCELICHGSNFVFGPWSAEDEVVNHEIRIVEDQMQFGAGGGAQFRRRKFQIGHGLHP